MSDLPRVFIVCRDDGEVVAVYADEDEADLDVELRNQRRDSIRYRVDRWAVTQPGSAKHVGRIFVDEPPKLS